MFIETIWEYFNFYSFKVINDKWFDAFYQALNWLIKFWDGLFDFVFKGMWFGIASIRRLFVLEGGNENSNELLKATELKSYKDNALWIKHDQQLGTWLKLKYTYCINKNINLCNKITKNYRNTYKLEHLVKKPYELEDNLLRN